MTFNYVYVFHQDLNWIIVTTFPAVFSELVSTTIASLPCQSIYPYYFIKPGSDDKNRKVTQEIKEKSIWGNVQPLYLKKK